MQKTTTYTRFVKKEITTQTGRFLILNGVLYIIIAIQARIFVGKKEIDVISRPYMIMVNFEAIEVVLKALVM